MAPGKKPADRAPRMPVSPLEIKGKLIEGGGASAEVVLIWNVSEKGLCLWVTRGFKSGQMLELAIELPWEMSLACEVRWCRTVPDKSGYLLGLLVTGQEEEFEKIHKALRSKERRAG